MAIGEIKTLGGMIIEEEEGRYYDE